MEYFFMTKVEHHGSLSKILVRTQAALALFILLWLGGFNFSFQTPFTSKRVCMEFQRFQR